MPESPTESAHGAWSVPQCPFTIEYGPRVMDDIRLAVMDAFFSLPRGGAEIGGILLGSHASGKVTIVEQVALNCEHATGPSFVLSANDEAKLKELLDQSKATGLQPVGWYHSHTRTDIFLSEADQEIHRRFFPQAWQVALVFKPHTFQPMRCGFFFQEPDGSIHASAPYQEFTLEPMPLRTLPTGDIPPMVSGATKVRHREALGGGSVIDVSMDAPPPAAAPAAAPAPALTMAPATAKITPEIHVVEPPKPVVVPDAVVDPPKFVTSAPRSGLWLKGGIALCLGLTVGAIGFQTRQFWLTKPADVGTPAVKPATPVPPSLNLTTADANGQLQVQWDRSSPAVLQGTAAVLTIADGEPNPREIRLDPEQLKSGSFTYARESEQVNLKLAVSQPTGPPVRGIATFVGKLSLRPGSSAADAQIAKLRADVAAQVEQTRKVEKLLADQSLLVSQAGKLKTDLAAQSDRIHRLEKSLSDAQVQAAEAPKLRKDLAAANERIKALTKNLADSDNALKQQQRKRMGAQDPGSGIAKQ
jgi:proteasome lid subunit RPN8/RPN11